MSRRETTENNVRHLWRPLKTEVCKRSLQVGNGFGGQTGSVHVCSQPHLIHLLPGSPYRRRLEPWKLPGFSEISVAAGCYSLWQWEVIAGGWKARGRRRPAAAPSLGGGRAALSEEPSAEVTGPGRCPRHRLPAAAQVLWVTSQDSVTSAAPESLAALEAGCPASVGPSDGPRELWAPGTAWALDSRTKAPAVRTSGYQPQQTAPPRAGPAGPAGNERPFPFCPGGPGRQPPTADTNRCGTFPLPLWLL